MPNQFIIINTIFYNIKIYTSSYRISFSLFVLFIYLINIYKLFIIYSLIIKLKNIIKL
jgi:hypothetical protein